MTSLVVLHNPPVETEPRRVLDVVCDSRQLPNGLIFNNITWTIPSDAATVESISRFIVWLHRIPTNSITATAPANAESITYQVSMKVTMATIIFFPSEVSLPTIQCLVQLLMR